MLRTTASALVAALFLCACKGPQEEAPPSAPADAPPAASAPVAAAPPAQPAVNANAVVGRWCVRTIARAGGEPEIDGSSWELKLSGSFEQEGDIAQKGTWTLAPGKLAITGLGDHEIVELGADHMVLRRANAELRVHRSCGAEVDKATRATDLRKASAKGDMLIFKAVLAKGAQVNDVDTRDMARRTPLLAAVENGHVEIVRELIERGADVTAVTASDKTAFDLAWRTDPGGLLPLLAARLQRPGSLETPVIRALPETGACPPNHVALRKVCVHAYGLPRRNLHDEITEFAKTGKSPMLAKDHWKDEIKVAELKKAQELSGEEGYEEFGTLKIGRKGDLVGSRELDEREQRNCDRMRRELDKSEASGGTRTNIYGVSHAKLEKQYEHECE